jgi:dihydroorotase
MRALAPLNSAPAALLDSTAGTGARGAAADLCLFQLERVWRVESGDLPGRAKNTPFDGSALEGVMTGTLKAGRQVF